MNKKCPIAVFRPKEVAYFIFLSFLKVPRAKSLPALWAQTVVQTAEPPEWRCRPVYPAGSASRSARPLPRCSPETWLSYGGTTPNSSPDRREVAKVKRNKKVQNTANSACWRLCPDVQANVAETSASSERSSNFWHALIFDIMLKTIKAKKQAVLIDK